MFRNIFRKRVVDDVREPLCSVRMQPIAELLAYVRPQFQRTVNEAHVESLMSDIQSDWRQGGTLSVLQSLSVAELPDGSHYILDGSHRMMAFSRLVGKLPPIAAYELPVVVYRCASHAEVLHWYARINHHLPIHPMELELAWADKVKPLLEHIQRRYRIYLSKSTAPMCPNIHLPALQTALQERASSLQDERITAENLVEDVTALHREVHRLLPLQMVVHPKLEKCRAKQPDDPCFLGFWRHGEWIDLILFRRLRGLAWEGLDWASFDGTATNAQRRAIPKPIRRQVWAKANPANAMTGNCFLCGETLHFDDMECAHNVPHCLGGQATIENLWPSCRTCNRDMGIRLLSEYKDTVARMRGGTEK